MKHSKVILPIPLSLLLVFAFSVYADSSNQNAEAKAQQKATPANTITVNIKDIRFVPAVLSVSAGTTVKWINLDPVDHDVTSGISVNGRQTRGMKQTRFPDNKFASGLFGKNKSFSYTFNATGEYPYYCNIHPFMVAKIIVNN